MDVVDFIHNSKYSKEQLEAGGYLESNRKCIDRVGYRSPLDVRHDAALEDDDNGLLFSDDVKKVDSVSMLGSCRGSLGEDFQELLQLVEEFETEEIAKNGTAKSPQLCKEQFGKENGARDLEDQKVSLSAYKRPQNMRTNGNFTPQSDRFRDYYPSTASQSLDEGSGSDFDGDTNTEHSLTMLSKRGSPIMRKIPSQAVDRNSRAFSHPFTYVDNHRKNFGVRSADDDDFDSQVQGPSRRKHDTRSYQGSQRSGTTHEKSFRVEVMKRPEEYKSNRHVQAKYENKEAQGIPPLHSGSKPLKVKGNNYTRPVSFSFTVDNRLQKRKQFYTKLAEKHKVMEEEKNTMVEKTKEELDSEIKELRKNLIIKANPVPSFYQEGPPPKAELKKIPTTRAKSPNFTRRCSADGTGNRYCLAMRYEQECNCRTEKMTKSLDETSSKNLAKMVDTPVKKPQTTVRRALPETLPKKATHFHSSCCSNTTEEGIEIPPSETPSNTTNTTIEGNSNSFGSSESSRGFKISNRDNDPPPAPPLILSVQRKTKSHAWNGPSYSLFGATEENMKMGKESENDMMSEDTFSMSNDFPDESNTELENECFSGHFSGDYLKDPFDSHTEQDEEDIEEEEEETPRADRLGSKKSEEEDEEEEGEGEEGDSEQSSEDDNRI